MEGKGGKFSNKDSNSSSLLQMTRRLHSSIFLHTLLLKSTLAVFKEDETS